MKKKILFNLFRQNSTGYLLIMSHNIIVFYFFIICIKQNFNVQP